MKKVLAAFVAVLALTLCSQASYDPPRVLVATLTTNSTTTPTDVTGLTFWADANTTYELRGALICDSAATTTGVRCGVYGPSGTTITAQWFWMNTAGSGFQRVFSQTSINTVVATTAAGSTANNGMQLIGSITTGSTAGFISIRVASEIDTSQVSVNSGSTFSYERVP